LLDRRKPDGVPWNSSWPISLENAPRTLSRVFLNCSVRYEPGKRPIQVGY
jgi:hypothetical protein